MVMAFLNNEIKQDCGDNILSWITRLSKILDDNAADDGKDYSVYTGASGQALLHLHLHQKLPRVENDTNHLQQALSWLQPCLRRLKGHRYTFLCGDAGPLAIAAVVYNALGDSRHCRDCIARVESFCHDVCNDRDLPDEVLYGRSGYLASLLFIQHHLGKGAVNNDLILQVVEAILRSGEELSRQERWSHPLMYEWHGKPYLGAAHGLAGIYFMLLQVDDASVQERVRQLVYPCVNYMLSLRFASGNCPSSLGSSSGDKLVHWCHGAPGWVQLFAKAYKVYKDSRFLEAATACGAVVWERGLLHKGYGLCHGSAGNAYTFLTLFRLTGEERYLYYAYKFAEWCADYGKHGCRTPDRPFSLFEGLAGSVYFLADLLDPVKSAYPTYEFFGK